MNGQYLHSDAIKRVHSLAYDLALGAVMGRWHAKIHVSFYSPGDSERVENWHESFHEYWQEMSRSDSVLPMVSIDVLEAFGYVQPSESDRPGYMAWTLTQKAMALLDRPPTSIFISYKRDASSSLAMLIWSELRLMGFEPFFDIRNISVGDEWKQVLENRVRGSDFFVLVVAPTTFNSAPVCDEIRWALETPSTHVLPILHGGADHRTLQEGPFPTLIERSFHRIEKELSLDLYNAIEYIKTSLRTMQSKGRVME